MIRKLSLLAALFVAAAPDQVLLAQQPGELLIGGKTRAFWIASLKSGDVRIRRKSCSALGLLGPDAAPAIPFLIDVATNADEPTRRVAMYALSEIGPAARSAVPLLLNRILESKTDAEFRSARPYLVGIGRPAVLELTKQLANGTEPHKIWLVQILAEIGPEAESAVPALLAELERVRDRSSYRFYLIEALGGIGPSAKPAAPALYRLLADLLSDGGKATDLATPLNLALIRIGEPAVPLLIERLAHRDSNVRLAAAALLGQLGPAAKPAIEKLSEIVKDHQLPDNLRQRAAIAFSRIDPDSPPVLPALIEAIGQQPNEVIAALRDLGPRAIAAMPHLIKLLDLHDHELSRDTCAVLIPALPQIDPEGLFCLPALIRTVETRTGTERAWAVVALGQIGPPARASVPSLIRTFMTESANHSDERTCEILGPTAIALRKIGAHPNFVVPAMISVLKDQKKADWHRDSLVALSGYGPATRPAIPQLILALDGTSQAIAAEVLGAIGPDAREALPALRRSLKQQQPDASPDALLLAICRIDPASTIDPDALMASIDDFHARAVISGSLGRTSPEGEGLTRRYLHEVDRMMIQYADLDYGQANSSLERYITAFGSYGPSARAAIPRLTSLLNHNDRSVRSAAKDALVRIERSSPQR
jgi:HEAT repeat protein